MAPQLSAFNGGIWSRLERLVRTYAKQYGTVYVLTGSVLQEPIDRLPSGRVAIPSDFYKVLLRVPPTGPPEILAILLPHQPFTPDPSIPRNQRGAAADAYLADHLVSLKDLERLTRLDLLPKLDLEALKHAVANELWPRN